MHSQPLGETSHQKARTTTGAAPFDRESLHEFEVCTPSSWEKSRTRGHGQRRELRRSIGNHIRRLRFALPAPGRKIAPEGTYNDGSCCSIGDHSKSLKLAPPAPGKNSHQAARTTTGAAPFDRLGSHSRSLKFALPAPGSAKSHQKARTTTGVATGNHSMSLKFAHPAPERKIAPEGTYNDGSCAVR